MENLSKFSKISDNATATCKRDSATLGINCAGGGVGGATSLVSSDGASGGIAITNPPIVSAHTSTWLAALHVNNNNNADKSFINATKDTHQQRHHHHHHHHHQPMYGNKSTTTTTSSSLKGNVPITTTTTTTNIASQSWECESCDIYQKNNGQELSPLTSNTTMTRVALIEEDEGGGGCGGGSIAAGIGVDKFSTPSLNGITSTAYHTSSGVSASNDNNQTARDLTAAGTAVGPMTTTSSLVSPLLPTTSFLPSETDYNSYDMCGAVSLSPPLLEDPFDDSEAAAAAAALGGGHSNRTSLNNSTENLSYTSDNFYGDDLILLGEDGDLEAEELSLNSDDCIYAYRGAGADFDLALPPLGGIAGNFGIHPGGGNIAQEEETDFLEMDFDPDPPSELEYNHGNEMNVSAGNKEQYLMQRDACHLATPTQRHQLFSSPIDDLPPAPKALQAQSLLSKNFARITLHLDQIQKDYNEESDEARERLNSALDSRPLEEEFVKDTSVADTCHSLPNTLHEHFTNRCNSESAVTNTSKDDSLAAPLQILGCGASSSSSSHAKSPSKITGAKPKRLSTFSSTSSTSSKNSSKSRNSLRSAFQTSAMGATSSSFDERSVSCSEFRTERDLASTAVLGCKQPSLMPHTAPTTATSLMPDFNSFNDETCLDCLEKEFLANTIGKALDPSGCMKCRKRLVGHHSMLFPNHHQQQQHQHPHHRSARDHLHHQPSPSSSSSSTSKYRRSASPTTTFFFNEQTSPTSRLFSCEFLNSQARKRQEWDTFMQEQQKEILTPEINLTTSSPSSSSSPSTKAVNNDTLKMSNTQQLQSRSATAVGAAAAAAKLDIKNLNESLKDLETKLLKNLKLPDPCTVTLSTNNLTESSLVQALDKLQIAYNQEHLKVYFKKLSNNNNSGIINNNNSSSSSNIYTISHQEFKTLKDFLLYVSKRQGNYHKLKRLIGKITQQQVIVQFKEDPSITELEMVPVRVSDILHYWSQCKNLECLKDLDKRFHDANILGKIANIIRQAHQRSSSSSRRPLPEFISIPQYYPTGFLTIIKK
ncbi:uncharacterized protein LOC101894051 [Musca domestica]|uniref:Uncharacterized protein LOC101894051 n=1 Tax=Musca domestica TaxID=7370 RepID=A0A1I8NHT3_MUSDO|nr:uncharacterized protein LOC101894051 [Musca domestica]